MRIGINWAAGAPAPTLPGYGIGPFGIRLPIMMGVTFASKDYFGPAAGLNPNIKTIQSGLKLASCTAY
jgi:hypothetical protein